MNPQKNLPALTPEEYLKFENDLLKAKLTAEFGMEESDTSKLDYEMENQWLNYIYEFENKYKDAKRITVFEYIGKPEFRSLENEKMSESEIAAELDRILYIMEENGVRLDLICEYEKEEELVYKFITEELFKEEVDDMRIEGMNQCFIYEEFHPNHKDDLTNYSEDFLNNIFNREWDNEFHSINFSKEIEYAGQNIIRDDFGKLIQDFQNSVQQYNLISKEIKKVEFDLDKGIADVSGMICFTIDSIKLSGEFKFDYVYNDYGYWIMCKIVFPGNIFSK